MRIPAKIKPFLGWHSDSHHRSPYPNRVPLSVPRLSKNEPCAFCTGSNPRILSAPCAARLYSASARPPFCPPLLSQASFPCLLSPLCFKPAVPLSWVRPASSLYLPSLRLYFLSLCAFLPFSLPFSPQLLFLSSTSFPARPLSYDELLASSVTVIHYRCCHCPFLVICHRLSVTASASPPLSLVGFPFFSSLQPFFTTHH